MAQKQWTSQADWQTWTADASIDLTTAPGSVLLDAGQPSGTLTSPAYQAAGWVTWSHLEFDLSLPTGANVYARVKVASTEGGLVGAAWSSYMDGQAMNGTVQFNLGVEYLNSPPGDPGDWIQIELTLVRA